VARPLVPGIARCYLEDSDFEPELPEHACPARAAIARDSEFRPSAVAKIIEPAVPCKRLNAVDPKLRGVGPWGKLKYKGVANEGRRRRIAFRVSIKPSTFSTMRVLT
jgi:hypothetical protein